MFWHYTLVLLRNFLKQKSYWLSLILGLSVSLICALLIGLWVKDEFNKDSFHKDLNSIHQVLVNVKNSEGIETWPVTPGPLADVIDRMPEVSAFTRLADLGPRFFTLEEKGFVLNGYFVDLDFFKIFNFELVKGNPAKLFSDSHSIILTESTASKYFNTADPIGQIMRLNGKENFTVTAIIKDAPKNSSIKFDFIGNFDFQRTDKESRWNDWNSFDYVLYLKLIPHANASEVTNKVNSLTSEALRLSGNPPPPSSYYLQPFKDRHLYSHFENGVPSSGRIKYVRIIIVVGVFLLLLGCVNFINLSIAYSHFRSKEIAVRKLFSGSNRTIIVQYVFEFFLVIIFTLLLTFIGSYLVLPSFNSFFMKNLEINYTEWDVLAGISIFTILTVLLASLFPSIVYSRITPGEILTGNLSTTHNFTIRKILIISQICLATVLVLCSYFIFKQFSFIKQTGLSSGKEYLVMIPTRGISDVESATARLERISSIASVTVANEDILNVQNQNSSFNWQGKSTSENILVRTIIVGRNFAETTGLKLLEGRMLGQSRNDSLNVLINEQLAKLINVPSPSGLNVEQWGMKGKIVGVVEDFHCRPLTEAITPTAMIYIPDWGGNFYVRLTDKESFPQTIQSIEKVMEELNPQYPFQFTLMEDRLNEIYEGERNTGKTLFVFTFIVIVMTSIGITGLVIYILNKSQKGFAIRKILGATNFVLVKDTMIDFIKLISLAVLISSPISYAIVRAYLLNYAYRIEIAWIDFILVSAGISLYILILISLKFSSIIKVNPVKSLNND